MNDDITLLKKNQEYSCILLLMCFILVHINISYFIPNFLNVAILISYFVIVLFLVQLFLYITTRGVQSIKFNFIDLVVLAFYGYFFLNNLLLNINIFSDAFIELSAIFCVYYIVRQSKISYSTSFYYLQFTAVVILFIESMFCFLQWKNIVLNLNSNYEIGGSYGHPIFTAISISVLTPYLIEFFKKYTFREILISVFLPFALIVFLLFTLQSRAALLSVILSLIAIVVSPKIENIKKLKLGVVTFLVGLLVFLIVFVKSDSSLGRIFIWKKCLAIISENLFFGVGFGKFAFEYNKYQSLFFSKLLQPSKEAFLADYSESAFNEFFQFGVEMGLVGMAFLLVLLGCLLYFKNKISNEKPFFNAVLYSYIPLFFSWSVLRYFPIGGVFFIGLALLSKQMGVECVFSFSLKNKILIKLVSFFILVSIALFACNRVYYISTNWSVRNDRNPNYTLNLYKAYPELQYSDSYIYKYCDFLIQNNDYKRAAFVAENSSKWLNSPALYHLLYKIHFEQKEYRKAMTDLDYLINISPSKIYPKYALAKLFYSSGNKIKGDSLSKKILKIKPKILNADVILMKEELKSYLK